MRLYYHKTDGGAEYLCSSNVPGTEEGSFGSDYIVRIDGNIEKDAELNGRAIDSHEELLAAVSHIIRYPGHAHPGTIAWEALERALAKADGR